MPYSKVSRTLQISWINTVLLKTLVSQTEEAELLEDETKEITYLLF